MATNETHNGHNGHVEGAGTGTAQLERRTGSGVSRSGDRRGITRLGNLDRRDMSWNDPFASMQKLAGEMDSLFENFGFGRSPLFGRRMTGLTPTTTQAARAWLPQIEMEERDGNLLIRADLPGLNKDDVRLHVEGNTLTIQGERKDNREEKREGFYHSERSYGSFQRSISLPEGVDAEAVKANFRNGVLEVTMPAPKPREPRGRQIEVQD